MKDLTCAIPPVGMEDKVGPPCAYWAGCGERLSRSLGDFLMASAMGPGLDAVLKAHPEHGGRFCDLLHPSDMGYGVIAKTVAAAIGAQ